MEAFIKQTRIYFLFGFLLFSELVLANQYSLNADIQSKGIKEKKTFLINANKGGQEIETDSILISNSVYDKNGRMLKDISYRDGMQVTTMEFEYNSKNQKTKISAFNQQLGAKQTFTYKYDKRGNLTEEVCYENGKEVEYRKVYKYNSAGKKTLELKMKEENERESKSVFVYDQFQNLIKIDNFNSNDLLTNHYEYKYDLKNNRIEELKYEGDRLEWKFQFEYDDHNKKVSEMHFYPFKMSNSSAKYKYNKEGQLIEEATFNNKNQEIQKNSYRYENGKLVEEEKGVVKMVYEYDTDGNKIKEASYVAGGGLSIKSFNKRGDLLSFVQYDQDQHFFYEETYQYDPITNFKIKALKRNNDQSVFEEEEYKYNKYGDLIEQIKRGSNSQILSKNKFIYEYYE